MNTQTKFKTAAELRELYPQSSDAFEYYAVSTILPLTEAYEDLEKACEEVFQLRRIQGMTVAETMREIVKERDQLKAVYGVVCVHHNDAARQGMKCPICLEVENAKLKAQLEAERELRIMQLAGVSTASIQNTEASVKGRITSENPYYTTAYADTCRAIDREMKLRQQLTELQADKEKLASHIKSGHCFYADCLCENCVSVIKIIDSARKETK